MEGKKYWIVEGRNFDTHWTTQTDRVSFKSVDLWKFMEAYHEHKLKLLGIADVVGQSEQLKAFAEWRNKQEITTPWITAMQIEDYLKSL